MPIWPVTPAELPRWIADRVSSLGLTAEPDAITLLAERLEGNLLAAAQEIEKLKLLHGDETIAATMVADTVSDNARYDAFRLVDVALSGDARGAVRTLRGLKGEAVQPPALLWAVAVKSACWLISSETSRQVPVLIVPCSKRASGVIDKASLERPLTVLAAAISQRCKHSAFKWMAAARDSYWENLGACLSAC